MNSVGAFIARFLCGAQRAIPVAGVAGVGSLTLILAPVVLGQVSNQGSGPGYHGIWYDDTGQGAIEIAQCSDGMCGKVVWLKAPVDKSGKPLTDGNNQDARQRGRPICGLPILGGLKRQRDGSWDEGWIYDPKQGKQFDLELRMRTADALQVTGYLGMKFLSETFIWKRAPADIKKCA